ncbi:unnamed protein product [Rotaria sp. Silwood1]|nr:unnamed protein product [Rotaria sp. Silwood1]
MFTSTKNRTTNINQHLVQITTPIVNPIEQLPRENNIVSPPPPYTAQSLTNFDDSLPSYEHAINKAL